MTVYSSPHSAHQGAYRKRRLGGVVALPSPWGSLTVPRAQELVRLAYRSSTWSTRPTLPQVGELSELEQRQAFVQAFGRAFVDLLTQELSAGDPAAVAGLPSLEVPADWRPQYPLWGPPEGGQEGGQPI